MNLLNTLVRLFPVDKKHIRKSHIWDEHLRVIKNLQTLCRPPSCWSKKYLLKIGEVVEIQPVSGFCRELTKKFVGTTYLWANLCTEEEQNLEVWRRVERILKIKILFLASFHLIKPAHFFNGLLFLVSLCAGFRIYFCFMRPTFLLNPRLQLVF